jgi:hypothetical protein
VLEAEPAVVREPLHPADVADGAADVEQDVWARQRECEHRERRRDREPSPVPPPEDDERRE